MHCGYWLWWLVNFGRCPLPFTFYIHCSTDRNWDTSVVCHAVCAVQLCSLIFCGFHLSYEGHSWKALCALSALCRVELQHQARVAVFTPPNCMMERQQVDFRGPCSIKPSRTWRRWYGRTKQTQVIMEVFRNISSLSFLKQILLQIWHILGGIN